MPDRVDSPASKPGSGWLLVLFPVVAVLIYLVTVPLPWKTQLVLGILLIIPALIIHRLSPGRISTLVLILASCFCSARYTYYRYSETIWNVQTQWTQLRISDLVFVFLLLFAETYSFLILLLGCFQTLRPLKRRPVPLPDDARQWPSVDVFIPTYNEPLEVVRTTVLAALNMDWPEDRQRIYILDDGRRADFEEFAASCGVTYITRLDNAHAKAGNINNALRFTDGEYIAIFDCDHIPTRSFLQVTMGWFLVDQRLALLQTPHHYYSPDPFERNLDVFRKVPNEGALFYGMIQDGSDFWNATFFCGSCAVIRRTALEEIGGVAVETVTEDAHTALRLQTRGWNTAYINIPQAAGLATTRFSDHVGQRIRWARGMIQILRLNNPLFLRGLKLPQRLCYFNSTMHFLFAAPRLIFLTSPLVYLLLGRFNVFGYLPAILAYALPHLVISTTINSRIQGKFRHSFWNEIYEIALAPYILIPTLLAMVNPRWGKFNVTAKGSVVEGTFFDWRIARPFLFLLALNVCGVAVGIRTYMTSGDPAGVLAINLFWAFFNSLLLGATIAVAQERQQRRKHVRVSAKLPVKLAVPTGEVIPGATINLSNGGLAARIARSVVLNPGDEVSVALSLADGDFSFPVNVVDTWGGEIRLKFGQLTLSQEAALAGAIFSRADTWLDWRAGCPDDHPIRSMLTVLSTSLVGIGRVIRAPFARGAAEARPARAKGAAASIILLAACLFAGPSLRAAQPRPIATPATESSVAFQDQISLASLGYRASLALRGSGSRVNVYFGLPFSKLVTNSSLLLQYKASPVLQPGRSQIAISLNGEPVGTVPAQGVSATIALPSDLLVVDNTLSFELTGSCAAGCEDEDDGGVWAQIESGTRIVASGVQLAVPNRLALLPTPFFDRAGNSIINVPFAFDGAPSPVMLQAAAAVASWLGVRADYRGIRCTAMFNETPKGNAIFVGLSSSPLVAALNLPPSGPLVAIRDNPKDPYGKLLVITGANEREVLAAARAFSMNTASNAEDQQAVGDWRMPPSRKPYDAPKWLQTDRRVILTEGVGETELQTAGNGSVDLYFRLPPDLYYGARAMVPLRLRYRCSEFASAAKAEVAVFLNGTYIATRAIPAGRAIDMREETIQLPSTLLYGRNTLTVKFAFEKVRFSGSSPHRLSAAVLPNTELLIKDISHFSEMPRLDLFASTGFPFTRLADLSETGVVLPANPRTDEVAMFMTLLAFMGGQTGYPALRVTVYEGLPGAGSLDKDLLVIGNFDDQPLLSRWAQYMSLTVGQRGLDVNRRLGFQELMNRAPWSWPAKQRRALAMFLQGDSPVTGLLQNFRSPLDRNRSVVLISSMPGSNLDDMAYDWPASGNSFEIQGSVSLFSNSSFRSFYIDQNDFQIGRLGFLQALQYWSQFYYWLAPIAVFVCMAIAAKFLDLWLEARAAERLGSQGTRSGP